MKCTPYILGLLLLPQAHASAQHLSEQVEVRDVIVSEQGDSLRLNLTFDAHRRTLRNGRMLVFAPRITNGEFTVSFRPVVVHDRRIRGGDAQWSSDSLGQPSVEFDPIVNKIRVPFTYTCSIPFQEWMHNASVEAQLLRSGCCSVEQKNMTLLVNTFSGSITTLPGPDTVNIAVPSEESLLPTPEITAPEIPETDQDHTIPQVSKYTEIPVFSTGDTLSVIFPFVLSDEGQDTDTPNWFYDDERENSLSIFYRVGSTSIDPDFWNNHQTLNNLTGAIEIIGGSGDARVSRVVVAGFASPEGSFAVNDRLAWERAVSVKEYLMQHTTLSGDRIVVYNGSADWQGLRLLVSQDRQMPARDEVLDIIDTTPIWNSKTQVGRMSRIMLLRGGDVYRYMAEHLFPQLRNGAFIRVYYDNTGNEQREVYYDDKNNENKLLTKN